MVLKRLPSKWSFHIGNWVARKWKEILLVTTLGTFFMAYMAVNIRIDTDLTLLLPEKDPYFLQYEQFFDEAAVDESLMIVFDVKGDLNTSIQLAQEIKSELTRMVDIVHYFRKMDAIAMMGTSGIILSSDNIFQELWSTLNLARFIFENPAAADFGIIRTMGNSYQKVQEILEQLTNAESIENYVAFSSDQQLMVMNLLLTEPSIDPDYITRSLSQIRRKVKEITDPYEIAFSFTGSYQTNLDSYTSINQDFVLTTAITLALITILFFLIYGNVWITIGIFISLVVAGTFTIGTLTMVFGRLNITSSFVLAALMGLGIDFGIHIANRVIEEMKAMAMTRPQHTRQKRRSIAMTSIVHALNSTGKTTMIGGLTTATAFLSLLVVDSPALQEMGTIIAFGIIIFLCTMLFVLPPLMILFSPWMRLHSFRHHLSKHLFRLYKPFSKKGFQPMIYAIMIVAAIMSVFAVRNFQAFDFTPPPFIPTDTESQQTMKRMIHHKLASPFEDTVLTFFDDPAKLLAAKETFRERSPYIAHVQSLMDFVPAFIAEDFPIFRQQILTIQETTQNPFMRMLLKKNQVDQEIQLFFEMIISSRSFQDLIQKVFESDILPLEARHFFMSIQDEKMVYKAYVESSLPLFQDNNLKDFVEDLDSFGVDFFGYSILYYKVTQQVISSVLFALLLSSVIISITVLMALRRVSDTVIILSSLVLTLILLYGVTWVLGLGINFMTLLALPLIVGIGIDGSVHIISRFEEEKKKGHDISSIAFFSNTFLGTGKAVTLSGMTTMIAFLSFLAARAPILQNMGLVLAIGIMINWLMSLFWVTSLKIFQQKWDKGGGQR